MANGGPYQSRRACVAVSQLCHERMRATLLKSLGIFFVLEDEDAYSSESSCSSTYRGHAPLCGTLVPCPLGPSHMSFHFLAMGIPSDPAPYCCTSSISLRMAVGLVH